MNDDLWIKIYETRIVVGYLGEKNQNAWWDCNFLSRSSKSFLFPVFPKTMALAQYNGVCKAASIIHDEHIGIGKHFHLFRLTDSIERKISQVSLDDENVSKTNTYIASNESALRYLEIHSTPIHSYEGPVSIGDYSDSDLAKLLNLTISHYYSAFAKGLKVFPYYRSNN
jgi:hypothetical protein